MDGSNINIIDTNKKRQLEKELKELIDKKAKGAQIRSRAKWIDEGEINSSYFLKLEATHQNSNSIKSIRKGQDFITKSNDILGELCNFYTELYQSIGIHENKIKNYLDKVHFVNILSDEEKKH